MLFRSIWAGNVTGAATATSAAFYVTFNGALYSKNMIASGTAGPAISYGLGQGATVIAALWGIVVWKEFRGAPAGTDRLLGFMLLGYVLGLVLIISAR